MNNGSLAMNQPEPSFSEKHAGQNVVEKPSLSSIGVLLVHGLNGCQSDMEEIDEMLATHNFITKNMLLPGHGTQVRDMLPIGWPEWARAVRQELQNLQGRCERVFLVGHSLGGALCLHVAAHTPVAGVVTICAPAYMPIWMLPAVRLARRLTPMLPTLSEDIRDAEARRRYAGQVYRWTPMAPVESMLQFLPQLRAELPLMTAPVLIMNSLHDHVVPARDGQAIYNLVGAREKELLTFRRSYHVIMKDHDREELLAHTLAFIRRHAEILPAAS
jgi:carboxylesterase